MHKITTYLIAILWCTSLVGNEQQVVLITGANGGIGKAIAKSFHENGWKVWASYRKEKPHDLSQLKNVRLIRVDLTKDEQVFKAVQIIMQEDGRLDTLINNAGYGIIGAEETVTIEDMRQIFEVNFFAPMRLIQYVAPIMRRKKSGHIINISSTSGIRALPGYGIYAASKFALEGMSESLAVTLSPWNIQVSIVEPGTVKTNWVQNCVHGARICDEREIYTKYHENLFAKLLILAETGQECEEIADLVVKIAQTPKPNMRYQTSLKAQAIAAKKFVDATGNIMREEQIQFFNSVLNGQ